MYVQTVIICSSYHAVVEAIRMTIFVDMHVTIATTCTSVGHVTRPIILLSITCNTQHLTLCTYSTQYIITRAYTERSTHRIKVLQLLAEGKPLEGCGRVEGMETRLKGFAAHFSHHRHQRVSLFSLRLASQQWMSSCRENTDE